MRINAATCRWQQQEQFLRLRARVGGIGRIKICGVDENLDFFLLEAEPPRKKQKHRKVPNPSREALVSHLKLEMRNENEYDDQNLSSDGMIPSDRRNRRSELKNGKPIK